MYLFTTSFTINALIRWVAAFLFPLVIQSITDSAFWTAVSYAISLAPSFLILPFAGVIGDFFNKKRVLQVAEIFNMLLLIGLFFVPFTKRFLPLLFVIDFGLNALATIHYPIFHAMIPHVVKSEKIKFFNSYAAATIYLVQLIAPLLISFLSPWIGKKNIFALLLLGYFISFLLLLFLSYQEKLPALSVKIKNVWTSLYEGGVYIKNHAFFNPCLIFFFFFNFGVSFIRPNLIHYLKHDHHIADQHLWYYFLPVGVLSILGSLSASFLMRWIPSWTQLLFYACLVSGIANLGLCFPFHPRITLAFWALSEGASAVVVVTFFTLRQKVVPSTMLSRFIALSRSIAYLPMPLASLLSGLLFQYLGSFQSTALVGTLIILVALLFYKPIFFEKRLLPPP